MLSLVLAILGIVVGFFILELGIIFEVVAFIIAIKQKKNKEKYSNYAYYVSLIVGILQLIVWVASVAYTFVNVSNITDKTKEEIDAINKKYDTIKEYSDICSEKININDYNSFEEWDKDFNKCNEIVDECFDTYDQLDEAKKCADKIKE